MNPTLKRFAYPSAVVKEFDHWVVLIRPAQITPLSCVIAARADVNSLGDLASASAAELPLAIRGFETTVRSIAPAVKFNYLALMMVDPNPHFHAIPRYAAPLRLGGLDYVDTAFPQPVDMLCPLEVDEGTLNEWQDLLRARWKGAP